MNRSRGRKRKLVIIAASGGFNRRGGKRLRGHRRRDAAWETAEYPPVDAHFHIS